MSSTLEMAKNIANKFNEFVEELEKKENQNKVQLSAYKPGEVIFGNETDTQYIVLEHFEDGTTLVTSRNLMLTGIQFDSEKPKYDGSNAQKEINENCLPIVEADFGADNIVAKEVDMTTVDGQNPDSNIICKVRPLTFDEGRKYNAFLVNDELEDYYWTLTRWSTPDRNWKYSVAVVSPSGCIHSRSCGNDYGVRPFLYLKSNIFVSEE